MWLVVAVLVEGDEEVGLVARGEDSPVPMRTWKMEGPPEMVEGMVM
jgi:hypothetical protein